MPKYTSVESGHLESKIFRFVVNIDGTEALHVYEVQLASYPGPNNEIIYSGGYRQINVANQDAIKLSTLKANNSEGAFQEILENIKKNHNYIYRG